MLDLVDRHLLALMKSHGWWPVVKLLMIVGMGVKEGTGLCVRVVIQLPSPQTPGLSRIMWYHSRQGWPKV